MRSTRPSAAFARDANSTDPAVKRRGLALVTLNEWIWQMSGSENAHLWRPEALEGEEWGRLRGYAARALGVLER